MSLRGWRQLIAAWRASDDLLRQISINPHAANQFLLLQYTLVPEPRTSPPVIDLVRRDEAFRHTLTRQRSWAKTSPLLKTALLKADAHFG